MIVAVTSNDHQEYPEYCPLMIHAPAGKICSHPAVDMERQHLYCGYTNEPGKRVDPPDRCPLRRYPVEGVRIEVV